jgi:hypothetical protein
MNSGIRMSELTRDELLSHELVSDPTASTVLTYEARITNPEMETSGSFIPAVSELAIARPLLSIVLASGLTMGASMTPGVSTSYNTLVRGRPARVSNEIGDSLQVGPFHWVSALRQKVSDFGSLTNDWDGEGARAPSEATLQAARHVFEIMVGYAIRADIGAAPIAVPLPDGAIRFEWVTGNRELFLTVVSAERVEAQGWTPRDAAESVYYAEVPLSDVNAEVGWLRA